MKNRIEACLHTVYGNRHQNRFLSGSSCIFRLPERTKTKHSDFAKTTTTKEHNHSWRIDVRRLLLVEREKENEREKEQIRGKRMKRQKEARRSENKSDKTMRHVKTKME